MRILLSNDDGIYAPGLAALRDALQDVALVYISAPDRERSANGHQITMYRPIRARVVSYPGSAAQGWAVDGTPADSVKLALDELLPAPPDLVVAGINQGPNLGTDVLYSGTVAAAIEAHASGYPALAISLASYQTQDFSQAGAFIKTFVTSRAGVWPKETLLNINVPAGAPQGVRVTRLGVREYRDVFDKRTHPRGWDYYWMAGQYHDRDGDDPDTDAWAVSHGYISVTPLQYDLTDYRALQETKDLLARTFGAG